MRIFFILMIVIQQLCMANWQHEQRHKHECCAYTRFKLLFLFLSLQGCFDQSETLGPTKSICPLQASQEGTRLPINHAKNYVNTQGLQHQLNKAVVCQQICTSAMQFKFYKRNST
jgi:hypothetical protein